MLCHSHSVLIVAVTKGVTALAYDLGTVPIRLASTITYVERPHPHIMTDFSVRAWDGVVGKGEVVFGKV